MLALLACGARTGLPVTRRPVDPTIVEACVKLLSCRQVPGPGLSADYPSISDCIWG